MTLGRPFEEMIMKTVTALFVAAVVAIGTTVALAQEGLHTGRKSGGNAPPAAENIKGTESSIPAGEGGTAGTHPTGANVGPGRAGQVKID
jgi:hypothetical protein